MFRTPALALTVIALSAFNAAADPIQITFSVSGFTVQDGLPQTDPPTDPVAGSIVYDADELYGSINSLISIDLMIDGYTYSVEELSFDNYGIDGLSSVIGGGGGYVGPDPQPLATANELVAGTDDFAIQFYRDPNSLPVIQFFYTSRNHPGTFWQWQFSMPGTSYTFNFAQLDPDPGDPPGVPEPSTLLLLGVGGAVLGVRRGRRTVVTR